VGDSHLYLLTAGKERFTSPLCFLSFFIQDLWFPTKPMKKLLPFYGLKIILFYLKKGGNIIVIG
jgi:hypothetical protein